MPVGIKNITYRLPEVLAKRFRNIVTQGDRISPEVAGALALYLILPDNIRSAAKTAAYSEDIELALQKLRDILPAEITAGSATKPQSGAKEQLKQEIIDVLTELGIEIPPAAAGPQNLRDVLRNIVRKTKARQTDNGNRMVVGASDKKLWETLNELVGDENAGTVEPNLNADDIAVRKGVKSKKGQQRATAG